MFLDEYLQRASTAENILSENPQAAAEGLLSDISQWREYVVAEASSNTEKATRQSSISMLCWRYLPDGLDRFRRRGHQAAGQHVALAARINMAPTAKFKVFLYNISAAALFSDCGHPHRLAYVIFVLGIDFGEKPAKLLTCVVGGIRVFFSARLTRRFPRKRVKYGITIGGTILSCFPGGMMISDIKYWIQEYVPAVGYISPANLTPTRFTACIITTAFRGFSQTSSCCASCPPRSARQLSVMRRKNYASIIALFKIIRKNLPLLSIYIVFSSASPPSSHSPARQKR
jgi:hypothetical protein